MPSFNIIVPAKGRSFPPTIERPKIESPSAFMISRVILLSPNAPTKEPNSFSTTLETGEVCCGLAARAVSSLLSEELLFVLLSLLQATRREAIATSQRNFLIAKGLFLVLFKIKTNNRSNNHLERFAIAPARIFFCVDGFHYL